MNMPIICFHGSPGSTAEFDSLADHLGSERIIPVNRNIPEHSSSQDTIKQNERCFYMGYSWGAYDCIEAAMNQPNSVKGVILVSPYLFPGDSLSSGKKTILSLPMVSSALLKILGGKIVNEFMTRSCAPQSIPTTFQAVASELKRPYVLRRAALEKDHKRKAVPAMLARLKKQKLPIALIYGARDQVGLESEQVEPLRQNIHFYEEKSLPEAGHAIPWTHPEELAKFIEKFVNKYESW